MKTLQIEESETQLVIKIEGSNVAHVAKKDDAEDVKRALFAVLAEAPEHREPVPPEAPVTADVEMSVDDFQESIAEGLSAVGQLLNSEPAQRVRKALERLPTSRRYRKNG
jgi:hypothetical protein